jgi:ribosomal protein S18 acetylase RimI-like enzyme
VFDELVSKKTRATAKMELFPNKFLANNLYQLTTRLGLMAIMMEQSSLTNFHVHRASTDEMNLAWKILEEYYEAAKVQARDSRDDFEKVYFQDGAGFWLASKEKAVIGCIALRPLANFNNSGEIKRLYVQPVFRGLGVASVLYDALEAAAKEHGYHWLYLDTASDMTAAQKFYRQLGFETCDRYNDNPQAAIFMRKKL